MADRDTAVRLLDYLREWGVSDSSMIEHAIYRYFSSNDAVEFLEDVATENDIELEED